ncbi:SufE family protein [Parapedomonas caeni]|jgi:cysteine desulfuration protein SufE
MTAHPTFADLRADFELFDDWEDKYRALIDLGRHLEPMPDALKTPATKVRGCSSQVWLYAERRADGRLHFLGDSDAHIVRGLVALLFLLVQDRTPAEILAVNARQELETLGLAGHLSPTRTNGLYSMVARIRALAEEAVTA